MRLRRIFVMVSVVAFAAHAQVREAQDRFGISTTAVAVDVVVRDRNWTPVTGLSSGDFALYEDGVRQTITSLEEVGTRQRPPGASETAIGRANSPQSEQSAGVGSPPLVVALVFEELGPSALRLAHSAASSFTAASLAAETYFGVFTLDRVSHTASPYTNDPALLSKALHAVSLSAGRPIQRAGDVPSAEYGGGHPGQAVRSTADDNQFIRGNATLAGLEAVVQSIESYPGRKAIVVFSEGLALGADPRGAGTPDSGLADGRWDRLLGVVDRATKRHIAFYTFDADGLRAQNPSAGARYSMGLSPFGVEPYVGLQALAEETGGRYSDNTNDLATGLTRMATDLRHYYLLAYFPTKLQADGRYRRIEVKVNRRGVSVLHRKGYRATNDSPRGR
jgi:VWFA-related protein